MQRMITQVVSMRLSVVKCRWGNMLYRYTGGVKAVQTVNQQEECEAYNRHIQQPLNKGNVDAMVKVGVCFVKGMGVQKR